MIKTTSGQEQVDDTVAAARLFGADALAAALCLSLPELTRLPFEAAQLTLDGAYGRDFLEFTAGSEGQICKKAFAASIGSRINAPPAGYCAGYSGARSGELQSLYWAARRGQTQQLLKLLSPPHSLDPKNANEATAHGVTPLHEAALFGRHECVDMLLVGGADLEAATSSGRTPLHEAAFDGRAVCVERLLRAGAHSAARDKGGETARQWAVSNEKAQCVAVFDRWGIDKVEAAAAGE